MGCGVYIYFIIDIDIVIVIIGSWRKIELVCIFCGCLVYIIYNIG